MGSIEAKIGSTYVKHIIVNPLSNERWAAAPLLRLLLFRKSVYNCDQKNWKKIRKLSILHFWPKLLMQALYRQLNRL